MYLFKKYIFWYLFNNLALHLPSYICLIMFNCLFASLPLTCLPTEAPQQSTVVVLHSSVLHLLPPSCTRHPCLHFFLVTKYHKVSPRCSWHWDVDLFPVRFFQIPPKHSTLNHCRPLPGLEI